MYDEYCTIIKYVLTRAQLRTIRCSPFNYEAIEGRPLPHLLLDMKTLIPSSLDTLYETLVPLYLRITAFFSGFLDRFARAYLVDVSI